ncbi:TPA: ThiF family adenylyltransferase [Salmonella enterica subsp. enterica serovar Paratyphi B]|uniref:ThiF family adenylyltransferase n=2 Tax=Salmonella paratyphi B TaxID=57045 RepID=A0A8E6KIV7_SALEB|nr:ThiF family adenylyltransferase [Salmonella enterica]ECU8749347.1 thiamine biosynthesis protein ThiF [Salmonella enterica subsp. diarizonae str. CFSAN000558]QVQ04529.1 ThiF family adenylyltransferase [Salmonella enterica subsp. enterica serovar Paratyphi B str. CFSAN000541]HAE2678955.1 thiamine biosynthesis protein ThiF [Salmonella enterica subsp. enterica serovar Paratyphi B]HAE8382972.1 thiamine biosynthesis protein ThiF [Salmonella enterica subsp. diarizonae serovar 50:k:z]ASG73920.1 thi
MSTAVQVPDELQTIFEMLNADPRTQSNDAWVLSNNIRWSLKFTAQLSVPPSHFMPDFSAWHLVLWQEGAHIRIEMYPDKAEGISATFQHQSYNYSGKESTQAWATGNPCLENSPAVFGRHLWGNEPEEFLARVRWRLSRLLLWIDAAAEGNLSAIGEHLELPAFPGQSLLSTIAFKEKPDDLPYWKSLTGKWGYASSSSLPGTRGTRFIREFFDSDERLLRTTEWSPFMRKRSRVKDTIWFILPVLPVIEPWQAPRTWNELNQCFENCGLSFQELFADIGRSIRKLSRRCKPCLLMLGFPLQEKVGETPVRIHWLALRLTGISDKMTTRNGFRPTEHNHIAWDREQSMSQEPIKWMRTQNWASDQLRTRGEVCNDIRSKKVLIIGAGSLGSAIAENLMRIGVVCLGILDTDLIQIGNLSRHALTMTTVGNIKAVALVEHLNRILPDANARSFDCDFPPENEVAKTSLRKYEVIIDCTGEDSVLKAMASFDWQSEKIFISLAMTWRAEGLFAYAANETTFPAIDATNRFRNSPSPEIDLDDARIEGVGCWHPVFPARADDVQLWAAISTKFICRVVSRPGRLYEYFKQMPDGTVERQHHEN